MGDPSIGGGAADELSSQLDRYSEMDEGNEGGVLQELIDTIFSDCWLSKAKPHRGGERERVCVGDGSNELSGGCANLEMTKAFLTGKKNYNVNCGHSFFHNFY